MVLKALEICLQQALNLIEVLQNINLNPMQFVNLTSVPYKKNYYNLQNEK